MLELAADGRSPSFEYCANKQQATEATSENCWIFQGLKTNYPTNKQNKRMLFRVALAVTIQAIDGQISEQRA